MKTQARSSRSVSGFTLTEILVVAALIGMVVLFTAPNILKWYQNYRVSNAVRDVASLVQLSRVKAIHQNESWSVEFAESALPGAHEVRMFPTATPAAVEESVSVPVDIGFTLIDSSSATINFVSNGTADFTRKCEVWQLQTPHRTRYVNVFVSGSVRLTDQQIAECVP